MYHYTYYYNWYNNNNDNNNRVLKLLNYENQHGVISINIMGQ